MAISVERIGDAPIITSALDGRIGTNINGPSLIEAPDWLPEKLGRYYLFFAHHNGTYIRLATADAVEGPWRIYGPGVLDLEDSHFIDHIASPEVVVDDEAKQFRMYFHGRVRFDDAGKQIQATRLAISTDGVNFRVNEPLIAPPYLRIFEKDGWVYGLAQHAELLRSKDGVAPFESAGKPPAAPKGLPEKIRHVALWRRAEDLLTVFYTVVGDAPERVYAADLPLTGDWTSWTAGPSTEVLRPERDYEGADCPVEPSKRAAIDIRVNQLRDPDIFVAENGTVYMPYAIAGEAGLALAKVVL